MEDILLYLKGSYLLVLLLMLITISLVGLYDNIFQKEFSMDYYFSIVALVGLVSSVSIYINTIPEPLLSEEILSGPPSF